MKIFASHGLAAAVILAAGIAGIAAMNIPVVNSAAKNAAYLALRPLQTGAWVAGARVYGFFDPLTKAGSLASENERLRQAANDVMAKDARIHELTKENETLRQGLNLELDKDFDLKLVHIVAKNIAQDTLIIDKGSKDMVQNGMSVITSQKVLAGKVSKVHDNFSEVTLITNKDFSFDVKIGPDAIDGLVKGAGGFGANVDLVPKDKEIKDGDSVVTGILGGIFPAGLLVGTVKEIRKNDVETFQSAGLDLAFDINGALEVFVASGKYPLGLQAASASTSQEKK